MTRKDRKIVFNSTNELPEILTVEEVAAFLRIGRNEAYALCNTGTLRCVRAGRTIRVHRDELVAWTKAGQGRVSGSRRSR